MPCCASRARVLSKLAASRPPTAMVSGVPFRRESLSSQRTVLAPTRPLPPTTSTSATLAAAA
eukprot:scaffold74230_cov63-Phaeocystis_antarctica.AAC.3